MPAKRKYTIDEFIEAVKSSTSVRQVLLKLKLNSTGGNYTVFWKRVNELSLDTSHFLGQGWNKERGIKNRSYIPVKEYLGTNKAIHSFKLKHKLLKEEIFKNECSLCKQLPMHNNQELKMQLDHIDGNRINNSLDNLRLLCPNCHSQTSTFAGKNKGKGQYH